MKRILFVAVILLLACTTVVLGSRRRTSLPAPTDVDPPAEEDDVVSITEGIWGYVLFWEGDFRPPPPYSGTITGVSREMHIYELTSVNDVEPPGYDCFYSAVHTSLAAVVQSADNGFFEVALDPGDYSIFSVEDGLLYANVFQGGSIFPVTVEQGEAREITFDITYRATF